jgi:small multidrug resistance family-3 protein
MIKAIALGNNFLLTAIASSFLCWLASLHPSLLLFVQALFALKLVVSVSAWILDDALVALLKIDLLQLRFRLIASTIGALVGVGVMLCRS